MESAATDPKQLLGYLTLAKRVTTADFIERSRSVHGGRYNYSLVEYQGIHKYVAIICPKHGQFLQTPANHYQGKGCSGCGGSKPLTNETFIEAARAIHGDRYGYTQIEYVNNKTVVEIVCRVHGPFTQLAAVHLRGSGCADCAGVKRLTNETFIAKSKAVHGDRYSYSEVDYDGSHTQVTIVCSEHGPFLQSPSNHIAGKGCSDCGKLAASLARRRSTEQFVAKAKTIHHSRYDYSLVEYIGSALRVTIICSEHGPFEQTPSEHLVGSGCPKCGLLSRAKTRTKTTEEFIASANVVHGNRYDYSLVEYLGAQDKVTIICPEHGTFEQSPNGHLGGKGCYECGVVTSADAKRSTTEQFIAKARMVHGDRYDYSQVEYVASNGKVRIVCPDHGPFLQAPNDHVSQRSGCADCVRTGFNPADPGLLYYVAISTDDGDTRYKIGITNVSIEERFRGADLARIRAVKIWRFTVGRFAAERESEILYQFAGDRYHGPRLLLGAGNSEIFTHDVLELDDQDQKPTQPVVEVDGILIARPTQVGFDF